MKEKKILTTIIGIASILIIALIITTNEKDIKGIVIDAFTEPMVIDRELFEVIENLKSRL